MLLERLDSASCISQAERGLGTLVNSVKKSSFDEAGSRESQMVDKFLVRKKWRGKCLSYLIDERTIRILSGSNFIFSAPKKQWMKMFEPLKVSADSSRSGLVEVMVSILGLAFNHLHYCKLIICIITSIIYTLSLQEICLLGLVSRQWGPLIQSFVSHTFCSLAMSKQYADLHQLLQGSYQDGCLDKIINLKVLYVFISCLFYIFHQSIPFLSNISFGESIFK
jgi:hypothetical protein